MFRNGKKAPETAGVTETSVSGHGNGRNGHYHPSGILPWYFARPAVKGRAYLLTANGYVILPDGFPGSRKGLDMEELMR